MSLTQFGDTLGHGVDAPGAFRKIAKILEQLDSVIVLFGLLQTDRSFGLPPEFGFATREGIQVSGTCRDLLVSLAPWLFSLGPDGGSSPIADLVRRTTLHQCGLPEVWHLAADSMRPNRSHVNRSQRFPGWLFLRSLL